MTRAITRGTTSTCIGSMPITLSASTSSRVCMTPISAVKAEPERPATMMAVISTPISRNTDTATRLMVKSSPPIGTQLGDALVADDDRDHDGHQADDGQRMDAGFRDVARYRRRPQAVRVKQGADRSSSPRGRRR